MQPDTREGGNKRSKGSDDDHMSRNLTTASTNKQNQTENIKLCRKMSSCAFLKPTHQFQDDTFDFTRSSLVSSSLIHPHAFITLLSSSCLLLFPLPSFPSLSSNFLHFLLVSSPLPVFNIFLPPLVSSPVSFSSFLIWSFPPFCFFFHLLPFSCLLSSPVQSFCFLLSHPFVSFSCFLFIHSHPPKYLTFSFTICFVFQHMKDIKPLKLQKY